MDDQSELQPNTPASIVFCFLHVLEHTRICQTSVRSGQRLPILLSIVLDAGRCDKPIQGTSHSPAQLVLLVVTNSQSTQPDSSGSLSIWRTPELGHQILSAAAAGNHLARMCLLFLQLMQLGPS